ncbi:MAG: hypothetical protein PHQ75_09300 [Thermoguttaceae bacterium]|nr:hypothetical protein [Thermoguttaceae bacterium]
MSKHYALPTILRLIPHDCLRELFDSLKIDHSDLDWESQPKRNVAKLVEFINGLNLHKKEKVHQTLRSLITMGSEQAQTVLREIGFYEGDSEWATYMESEENLYRKLFYTLQNYRELYEKAQKLIKPLNMSWAQKRENLKRAIPHPDEEQMETIKLCIQKTYQKLGLGDRCTVEWMEHDGVFYLVAHPDDADEDILYHDEQDCLQVGTCHKTFEVCYALNSRNGTSKLVAKGMAKIKDELESGIYKGLFNIPLPPMERAVFNLAPVMSPDFRLWQDTEHLVVGRIRAIRAKWNGNEIVTFEVNNNTEIHEAAAQRGMAEALFGLTPPKVTSVVFDFTFTDPVTKIQDVYSFTIREPRYISMDIQNLEQERIILTILAKSGIITHEPVRPTIEQNCSKRLSLHANRQDTIQYSAFSGQEVPASNALCGAGAN